MRRADRLFRIVQLLQRRRRGPVTARQLAQALEVSERTVYRDVRDLVASGVPIAGEAGVGYALPKNFDLPPLMFNEEEIAALVLGVRVVESWGDAALAEAARGVLAKVEVVLPPALQRKVGDQALFAPALAGQKRVDAALSRLRGAIREGRWVVFGYEDERGRRTERRVRPLGLFYWGVHWTLGAWCETRVDFRNFRLDRMREVEVSAQRFPLEPARSLRGLFQRFQEEAARRRPRIE